MILAVGCVFKFKEQCFDLIERVISLGAITLKELCSLIKNIKITVLIETF